jgi:hypothetical protein
MGDRAWEHSPQLIVVTFCRKVHGKGMKDQRTLDPPINQVLSSWASFNGWGLSLLAFVHHGYRKANPVLHKLECEWTSSLLVQIRPGSFLMLCVMGA